MPGYDSQVIMAAGAFTLGASIELSADAPLREPYAAWMQGALNYHSGKLGVLLAAQKMLEKGVLKHFLCGKRYAKLTAVRIQRTLHPCGNWLSEWSGSRELC